MSEVFFILILLWIVLVFVVAYFGHSLYIRIEHLEQKLSELVTEKEQLLISRARSEMIVESLMTERSEYKRLAYERKHIITAMANWLRHFNLEAKIQTIYDLLEKADTL